MWPRQQNWICWVGCCFAGVGYHVLRLPQATETNGGWLLNHSPQQKCLRSCARALVMLCVRYLLPHVAQHGRQIFVFSMQALLVAAVAIGR